MHLPATLENARTAGIRSLLARMLLQRKADADGNSPLAQLAEMGAVADTGVMRDCLVVSLVGLADGFADYLPHLREIVFGGDFNWSSSGRETTQLHMLAHRRDVRHVVSELAELHVSGTSYAWPLDGTTASVQAIGQRELRQLHQAFFRPNNCVIAVSGPLVNDGCVRAIASALCIVLPGPQLQWQQSSLPDREAIYIHRPWSGDTATCSCASWSPPHHGDFAAVRVLWALLPAERNRDSGVVFAGRQGLFYSVGSGGRAFS